MKKKEEDSATEATEKKVETYSVVFTKNRSYELFIRKKKFIFEPGGSIIMTEDEIRSSEFQQVKDLFSTRRIEE